MLKGLSSLKVNFLIKTLIFSFFLFAFLNAGSTNNPANAVSCTTLGCPPVGDCPPGEMCTEIMLGTYECLPDPLCAAITPPPPVVPIIEVGPLFGALAGILIPGGIALALIRIAWSGYGFMISEGNPQKVAEAREDFIAAVTGALFILLSVVIFRVILNSFLGTPGF